MEQIAMSRARVPAVQCSTNTARSRIDRHLAVLVGPAAPQGSADEATTLMREITQRGAGHGRARNRGARVSLFAPLRRLRRTVLGARG